MESTKSPQYSCYSLKINFDVLGCLAGFHYKLGDSTNFELQRLTGMEQEAIQTQLYFN